MREWFAAGELAGIAGMPGTVQGVHKRARRDGWKSRPRAGRGGGREYHWHALPPETQAALLAREPSAAGLAKALATEDDTRAAAFQYDPEELSRWAESCTARKRAEGNRRAEIMHQVMALVDAGAPFRRAAEIIARQRGDVSAPSIRNWYYGANRQPGAQEYRRCDWSLALIPRHRGGQATAECSPEAWDYWLADYLRPEQPTAAACYRRLKRLAREKGWTIPSAKSLERRLQREIRPEAVVLARQGPKALERMYPAQRRDHAYYRALEAVNADGHTFDVMVRWPDGHEARPILLAWQDIYAGKVLSWRISETESSDAYRLSLYDLLRRYGLPSHAYVDNGRGIASKKMTGGAANRFRGRVRAEDPVGLLTQIVGERNIHWTTPYHGQAKPIERAFRDLCEDIARHPEVAGAYTGNSPANKPANYGSRAIPLEDFIALVDAEIRAHNAREGRRSPVCAGRSFDQVFSESYERHRHEIEIPTAAQLRRFLLAAEGVVAGKIGGEIRFQGNLYWCEALARYAGLPRARRAVVIAYDPEDLHSGVHVYAPDGREVGYARCQQAAGFGDSEASSQHTRARRQWARAQKAALESERRMNTATAAAQLRELRDREREETERPPEDAVVRRGVFRRERRVAGSDVQPGGEPDEYQSRFEELMLRAGEAWRDNVLPVGGGSNEES